MNKPLSLLTPFSTDLFTLEPQNVLDKNQILLHATSNKQVATFDGTSGCNLIDLNTAECIIDIEIYANILGGTNGT